MKRKKLFKSKTQLIVYSFIYILCIVLFIVISKIDFNKTEETESKRFSSIYNLVEEDNLFVFSNATEVLNIINGRSGVILMGFPLNKWTNYYASILDKAATSVGIDKIYYYDFLQDREENNGTYETIVNKLEVYVPVDDLENREIYAPTVIIVKNGVVLGYFDSAAIRKGSVKPEDYFTENERTLIYEELKTALKEYID